MKVAVKKDGHHFYTHINQHAAVDPVKPPAHPQSKDSDKKEDLKGKDPGNDYDPQSTVVTGGSA